MTLRLNNRFFPNTHVKKETVAELKQLSYDSDFKNPICDITGTFPVLTLCSYTLLLGYIKDNEFQGWLDKRHISGLQTNPVRPESVLTSLVLKAVNMFPNPDALLERVINRLQQVKSSKNV